MGGGPDGVSLLPAVGQACACMQNKGPVLPFNVGCPGQRSIEASNDECDQLMRHYSSIFQAQTKAVAAAAATQDVARALKKPSIEAADSSGLQHPQVRHE